MQKLFLEVYQEDPRFDVVIRFLIGLNSNCLEHLGKIFEKRVSSKLLQWLYESQCPKAISEYLQNSNLRCYPKNADYYALTYCIIML